MKIEPELMSLVTRFIVEETALAPYQVENTVALLQEGGTVPFIARYRKERTGELDEVAIRSIEERLRYYLELAERKETVLKAIEEQGKLTAELRVRIERTRQKTELEDLYLPYKRKRRTKATMARERGLEPLADLLATQAEGAESAEAVARPFVDPEREVPDVVSALAGAGHILAERLSEDADVRSAVRRLTSEKGAFCSRAAPDFAGTVSKFEMYYEYQEPLKSVPSHRMLAMRRGEKEEVLRLSIDAPQEVILDGLKKRLIRGPGVFLRLLEQVAEDAYRRLIAPSIEVELRLEAKKRADEAAIAVFADNLRNLLLAPPAGSIRVLGVDPGLRTGSKLAVVDGTGRFLEHVTVYPHTGQSRVEPAKKELLRLVKKHAIDMVAIGNGTAGREMEQFVRQTLAEAQLSLPAVMVSEAGASIYSASDIAREEFPDLDLTVRGAISIARRLQDPLAELVKLDPKSIGVGQYQHDVSQPALKKALDEVVESCVNYVGVDLNTASWALLSYVSGLGESLARAIVRHRDENGSFASRQALLDVSRFGAKAFEQAAGFLRIRSGDDPLDNTAVHPEHYALVARMAADLAVSTRQLGSDVDLLDRLDLKGYMSDEIGLPTLRDILDELKKPGRDPRQAFQRASYRDDVRELSDLTEGMTLQGTVTNVTAFGAFVDVGVHQDGLVHISHLADRFVKDPAEVVKVGQVVEVKVLSVDQQRKRIALSMRKGVPDDGGRKRKKQPPVARKEASEASRWEKAGFRVKRK